jgi:hypothetical protein
MMENLVDDSDIRSNYCRVKWTQNPVVVPDHGSRNGQLEEHYLSSLDQIIRLTLVMLLGVEE